MRLTWAAQLLTLITILLSVLIFAFFTLVYINVLHSGQRVNDDLRLIVYLDEEPTAPLQEEYRRKILKFDRVNKIVFVNQQQAFERFAKQLGPDRDVLEEVPTDFLPPSIEIYPHRSLEALSRIKGFSEYLQSLPGVLKVQYGRQWIERFFSFVHLMRIVVILSGTLLVLSTTFTVAHTIRLSLLSRRRELEILQLLGASANYIRFPFFFEGALQGLLGSSLGIMALYLLFLWTRTKFGPTPISELLPFTFLPLSSSLMLITAATLLCALGSFSSTRKILQL